MTKKRKIILLFVVVLILLLGIMVYNNNKNTIPEVKTVSKLDDPTLVYASQYWAGLCGNEKGENGGCYDELYLYNTGKLISVSGFINEKTMKKDDSTTEKNIGVIVVNQIIKKIKDSGVITKNCLPNDIMDAGWDYQTNLNGIKTSFHNPQAECKSIFDGIDKTLSSR
jgi:hypothetical protein